MAEASEEGQGPRRAVKPMMMMIVIQLKQIIKFDLAVFFSDLSHLRFLGLTFFVAPFEICRPWSLCPLCPIVNLALRLRVNFFSEELLSFA
jgi:hypothetical protein